MSATNTTPNIGLPSFIGTDKPSWLTDWNGAMSTIDSEVGTLKTDLSGDETRIGNLENSVSSLNTTVSNHTTSITALNTQVSNQGGTINTITSLIGNGTPTTTDQTIIGAINELHADVNNKYVIESLDEVVSYTPSGSEDIQNAMASLLAAFKAAVSSLSADQAADVTYGIIENRYITNDNNFMYVAATPFSGLNLCSHSLGSSSTFVDVAQMHNTLSNNRFARIELANAGTVTTTRSETDTASGTFEIHYRLYKKMS